VPYGRAIQWGNEVHFFEAQSSSISNLFEEISIESSTYLYLHGNGFSIQLMVGFIA